MSAGDPRPFAYADYAAAKTALLRALDGPRFYALVAGASGMGKTSLVRELRAELDRRRHQVIYVASPRTSVTGLVRLLARRLCLSPRRSYLETLEALAHRLAAHAAHLLLWLDEAEQLPSATLEQLRTLLEPDPDAAPVLSVVLSGEPALLSRLESPRLFALARRLSLRLRLAGLRRDELDAFLVHHFGPGVATRLAPPALDELFERTSAAPAVLERVVRHLLERPETGVLDDDHVRAALDAAGL